MDCCTISNIISRIYFVELATGIMTIFTGCLVVCNIYLWCSTDKAANAAKENAETAQESIKSFIAVERAYVYVSISADVNNWKWDKPGEDYELSPVKVRVGNYGRTPAKLKRIITKREKASTGYSGSGNNPDLYEIFEASGRIVAGNSIEDFFIPIKLSDIVNEYEKFGEGVHSISFSGQVEYDDIWRNGHTAAFHWILHSAEYFKGFQITGGAEENNTT